MWRFYQWCVRAWPLWATLFVIAAHQTMIATFPQQSEIINKAVSIGLQVLGGLLVLYAIDSTLGMFRGTTIFRVMAEWFLSCPIWRKPRTIEGSGATTLSVTASGQGRIERKAGSIAGRIAELERQMDEMYQDIGRREKALRKLISDSKAEFSDRVQQSETAIRRVEGKVDATALGSIKQQAFGVVIAIYGAGLGYLS
jgi:hypothetical protein